MIIMPDLLELDTFKNKLYLPRKLKFLRMKVVFIIEHEKLSILLILVQMNFWNINTLNHKNALV